MKPSTGKLRLNYDVAIRKKRKVGYGFTLRNEFGRNVLTGKMVEDGMGSNSLLKCLAMRFAMKMLRQYEMKTNSVDSDSRH